jgi:S-formylglutathione hydrolase FrmB
MGGYGALKIALKFTGLFSFAASFSGAFAAPSWSDQLPPPNQWDEYRPSISRIFGECDSKIRIENDVYKIVARCDRAKVPDLYFDCGIDDPFLSANEELSKLMGRCDIQHQFQALPGRHDWEYWADRGRFVIEMAARHFLKAETTS